MTTNTDTRWLKDSQFDEKPLSAVRRTDDGYALERDGDWGTLWIADPGFEPKVGEMARYYGEGMGFPVRGVVIAGRVARYQSAKELAAEMKRQSEEFDAKTKAAEQAAADAGRTEQAMRASDVPWPKSVDELMAYIKGLVDGPHTYGTCVYAASLSAVAAFYYVSGTLGMTGFQASCANLDILRRTRRLDGPFMLIKAEDALYPQFDLRAKLDEALEQWKPWLAEQAQKRLNDKGEAHPDVCRHWRQLAADPSAVSGARPGQEP